ncbi:hypothetical protein CHUAL_014156 [Chamberlinius hualienensis]
MENNEGDTSIGEPFLASGGHYMQSEEGDDSLGVGCDSDGNEVGKDDDIPIREQDRFLPIANVARIMKKAIPKTGKIAKDARECVQECVSEFISFITSEASDRCHQEKRKTINGEDILFAMSTLGFDNYVDPLKLYLQKYRDIMKGDRLATTTSSGGESQLDEMDDSFITAPMLTSDSQNDQQQQQNVVYTTTYPTQLVTINTSCPMLNLEDHVT